HRDQAEQDTEARPEHHDHMSYYLHLGSDIRDRPPRPRRPDRRRAVRPTAFDKPPMRTQNRVRCDRREGHTRRGVPAAASWETLECLRISMCHLMDVAWSRCCRLHNQGATIC